MLQEPSAAYKTVKLQLERFADAGSEHTHACNLGAVLHSTGRFCSTYSVYDTPENLAGKEYSRSKQEYSS